MTKVKPVTSWAVVSLVCSALAWVSGIAYFPLAERYGHMLGGTAGLASMILGLPILLAFVLNLLGVVAGLVAEVRVRSGQYAGRRIALAGIVLGCLPWALAVLMTAAMLVWRS
jgi:hypothetical protein